MSQSVAPPASPSLPSRRRRVIRWLFLCILVLFGIALVWYVTGRARDHRVVRQLEAEVRKRGEPLTLTQLAATCPSVPDGENAAIPLMDIWEKEDPAFWTQFRQGVRPLPARSAPRYDPELPFLGSKREFQIGQALTAGSRQAARSFLKERAAHIDAVRSALNRPRCRFPVRIEEGFDALVPHLAAIKSEAQTLRVAILIAAEGGDGEQALKYLEEMVRMSDLLEGEPDSIGQLVRASCLQMALSGTEDLLSRQSASVEGLGRLSRLVDSIQPRKMLTRSLVGERALILSAFDPSEQQPLARSGEADTEEDPKADRAHYRLGLTVLSAIGITVVDRRLILESMAELIGLIESDSPDAFRRAKQFQAALPEKFRGFPPKIFSRSLLPAAYRINEKFVTLEARKRAALVAIAVERYRLEHGGALPEQLIAVAPQFPGGVPKDPFNGESLHYRQLAKGYLVYSVGPDLRDDGGDKRERPKGGKYLDETFRVLR